MNFDDPDSDPETRQAVEEPIVEYVTTSGARTAVLRTVADGPVSTQSVLDTVSASESAVYGALGELRERDLIRKPDSDAWEPTGLGLAVGEAIAERRRTEEVLRADPEYWKTHDVTALPAQFRATLSRLADAEVVRATDTDPHRAVREVKRRIEAADSVAIVSPIYHDEFVDALGGRSGGSESASDAGESASNAGESASNAEKSASGAGGPSPDASESDLPTDASVRLVLGSAVVEETVDTAGPTDEQLEPLDIRVRPVSFAMTLTDDCLLLSLPNLDGSYDSGTELVAESESAREWGRLLFEHCWRTAAAPDASP
ncbi:helix-turn-helix transcriptional regulator [Halorussus salinus]|uniref:helix-turn-helix transcriptional regulator n=1 Tax=Halorussus salinus TaxID=1364935 RepID=UPI001EE43268|nr:transcriptional regulator FilR1 domain-containing protein [Halorussus salinus]